jgi:hypothetical protein
LAQNYAAKYQDTIDEVFRLNSVTDIAINKGIRLDYNGVNSVTIYGVWYRKQKLTTPVQDLTDSVRL